jgi:hypothetical protein
MEARAVDEQCSVERAAGRFRTLPIGLPTAFIWPACAVSCRVDRIYSRFRSMEAVEHGRVDSLRDSSVKMIDKVVVGCFAETRQIRRHLFGY